MTAMGSAKNGRSLFEAMGADVLYEALVQASGAFVWVVSHDGRVNYVNESGARWISMLAAEDEPSASEVSAGTRVAESFLTEQRGVMEVIRAGERATFRGIWRGVLLEVRVIPASGMLGEGDDSVLVGHPCVMAGSRGSYAAHPLEGESIFDILTANEREVLELIGLGLKTKEIANIVHRSEKTIEARRSAIGRKLGIETRGELVRIAVRSGLSEL